VRVSQVREYVEVPIKLEKGEIAALSLAKQMGVDEVLIDDAPGRYAVEILNLKPRGTIFVLLKALKRKEIDFDEFFSILRKLLQLGFRLKEEVYLQVVQIAREIALVKR